jgi:hypothetical protein
MKKDQVERPGFFVSEKSVKLAFKDFEETKNSGRVAHRSFFSACSDRDSAKLIPDLSDWNSAKLIPIPKFQKSFLPCF